MPPPSIALITGASRGIGRALASTLAAEGWQVLAGVRDPAAAPPGTHAERLDVADPASIDALAQRLHARGQSLDVLVNNAGIYRASARELWDVNVRGPLLLTLALEPRLAADARVVFVSSGLGRLGSQADPLRRRLTDPALSIDGLRVMIDEAPGGYGASKAALIAMARVFAARLPGPRVNAISPGWVRTDMGGAGAPLPVEAGVDSILWALRLPADGPSGGAFEHGRPLE